MSGASVAVVRDIRIMAAISSTSGSYTSAWPAGLVESSLVLGISVGIWRTWLPFSYLQIHSVCSKTEHMSQRHADKADHTDGCREGAAFNSIRLWDWHMHACLCFPWVLAGPYCPPRSQTPYLFHESPTHRLSLKLAAHMQHSHTHLSCILHLLIPLRLPACLIP